MRNLVTGNRGRYGLLQLCLTVVFALMLLPAMALGQTFVQIADNNRQAAAQLLPLQPRRLLATSMSS